MGKTEVEWTLQLKEIHDLSKSMNIFSLNDLIKKANQSEKEIRRNISILLSLGLLRVVNQQKSIYEFRCG